MATLNTEIAKYNKLREGHAKALNFDIDNMTEEQEHELAHRLETYGVVKPQSAPALPGTSEMNPSAGIGGEIAAAPKGRAKRSSKNTQPPASQPISPANFSPEIVQVFEAMAQQGDAVGAFGMQVFRGAMSRQIKNGMVNLVLDGTQGLEVVEGSPDAFLDGLGF